MTKEYKVAECRNCYRVKFIAAQGWCRACYMRWKRTGTLELKSRKKSSCKVDGCDRVVVSHGFCEKHWDRVVATGDPHRTLRPDDWGQKGKHPLYYSWSYAKVNSGVAKRWEKFWNFVSDVVDRPTPTSRLFKLRESEPLGPDNYEWREPIYSKESHAQYMREYRKDNFDRMRGYDLQKNFGITLEDYERMLKEQNGVCAICGQVNTVIDRRTGVPRNLAVDHCHKKGNVRKLLCQGCNQGLGNFRDDPDLLRKAADYLVM